MRSGIIAKKMGMTRIFSDDGEQIPVTVLRLEKVQVVAQKTQDKDGYFALKLGSGSIKAKNCNKSLRGQFSVAKIEPKRKLKEFRVSSENLIDVGKEINASHYVEGQYVDVSGLSIGKGFAGAMKRHNFSGLRVLTVYLFLTGHMVQPDSAKILDVFLKEKKWQVIWVIN